MSFKKQKLGLCLHAAFHRIQENVNHGLIEHTQDSNVSLLDRSLRAHLSFENPCETNESNSTEGNYYLHEGGMSSVETKATRTESDITLLSTESSPGFNSPQNSCSSPKWVSSITGKTLRNIVSSINRKGHKTKSIASSNELTNSTGVDMQSILPSENPQISYEINVEKLKGDILTLVRKAELSDLELQTLRKQVVKETKRARDLSNEVIRLKRENWSLNTDCEKYKCARKTDNSSDPWLLIDEYHEELTKEKELNENFKIQLQNMQDCESRLTPVVDKGEKLVEFKEENSEVDNPEKCMQTRDMCGFFSSSCTVEDVWGEDALKELVLGHRRAEEAHLLEQKNIDLCCEIEMCKREKEEGEAQMEQIALDYEILKQENHELLFKLEQSQIQEQLIVPHSCNATVDVKDQFQKLGNEIAKKSQQCYDSSITIGILERRVKALEEEMKMRSVCFEVDLESVISDKIRQEQRAILAEEALNETRWKNANAAQRLQLEFRRLSSQMESTFSANEKMMMQARSEAHELRLHQRYLEQLLEKANKDPLGGREIYKSMVEYSGKLNSKVFPVEYMRSEGDRHKDINSKQEEVPVKETDFLQRSNTVEKYELENFFMSIGEDNCNTTLNHLQDHKVRPDYIQSNVDELKAECLNLKLLLSQANSENDELKKYIVQLKQDLFIGYETERCLRNDEVHQVYQSAGNNITSDLHNFLEVDVKKGLDIDTIARDVLET